VPNLKEVDAIRHLDPIEPPHTFIRLSIIGAPSGTHGSSTLDQALIIQHWLVPVVRKAGAARQLLGAVRFGDATELLEELVSANPESTPAWGLLLRTHVSGGDPMGAVEASREWLESGASEAPSAADVQTLERSVAANGDAGYWSWMLGRLNTELEADTHVSHMDLAAANAGMGNDDAAITHLAAALAAAEPGLLTLRSDPVWDDLRRDNRFESLLCEAQDLRFSPTMRGWRGGGAERDPDNNR